MAHAAQEMRDSELTLQTRMHWQLRDARAESALANESAAAASAAAMAMLTRTATVPPEPPVKAESSTAQVKFIGLGILCEIDNANLPVGLGLVVYGLLVECCAMSLFERS